LYCAISAFSFTANFIKILKTTLIFNLKTKKMKKQLFTLAFALMAITTNATVITVNNGTVGAGQYTSVQDAVDASQVGDTIYVHGSQTSYGNVTLNKRLVLLGAGHHPKGTQYNFSTNMGAIYLSQGNSTTIPTATVIKGIRFNSLYGQGGSLAVNNIIIERSWVSQISVLGSGWILRNNFIGGISITNHKNVIISNNFFTSYILSSDKPSVIITNNIFLQNAYISSVNYATVTNNIFIKPNTNISGTQNTYNKNVMIYADPANYIEFPLPNNTGVGNLNTTESQFTETIPLNVNSTQALTYEWKILETSLGHKYGTDGTNIGIHGGSYQMPNLTGAPNLPQMVSMDIQNSVIPQNGKLTIEFKARGQQ
jgi:hypothetical protein